MRILLLNPPYDREPRGSFRNEGLALGYIAAVLRRDGHEVEVFDARIQRLQPRDIIRDTLKRDCDCLGITAADAQKHNLISIVRAVRRRKKDAVIVVGGYLPTLAPAQLLAACPEIDFLVRGEGEAVASDVFGRIARGEDWRETPGIAFLRDGEAVTNPPAPLIQDLDSLPFPARDALDQTPRPVPALIAGSRGCYHRCAFCCIHSFYSIAGNRPPRFRSAPNIVAEIGSLVAERGLKQFGFVDDDFIGPSAETRDRAARIAQEIIDRKLGITFSLECRADEVEEDLLQLLKEAGLTHVLLGVESGVQAQLDRYNKRITVEQNKRAIEMVRRSGVKLTTGFIMLDPYVTPVETNVNMKFLREMGLLDNGRLASAQSLMKLKLFHGIPLAERVRADGLLREKGLDLDYSFSDPQFRILYGILHALGACSSLVRRVRGLFRRDPSRPHQLP